MNPLFQLTHELAKLPGVGEKSALRLALFILKQPSHYPKALAQALLDLSEKMRFCQECFHITEAPLCNVCTDASRDERLLCVVEDSSDLLAIEKSRGFKGHYHVLQGVLSPLDGVGPEQLRIQELLGRLSQKKVEEVILATNPNVSGDATALLLSRLLQPFGVRLTKLASGIPQGSDIEYIDTVTLGRALQSRVDILPIG